jgi:hypothetical protein
VADTAGAQELTEGLTRLAPALRRVEIGNGARLVQLIAGLIEVGADPLAVLDLLVERITEGLEQAARFPALAAVMGGHLTRPTGPAEANVLLRRIAAAGAASGVDGYESGLILQAWFTINDWMPGLLLPLQHKRARQALPGRPRLAHAVDVMIEHAYDAVWLQGLLQVLDDEPLIVVHRATGTAYQITISGVGDNYQLHTLLAATLIGDPHAGLIPGLQPDPTWVAAATTGEMNPSTHIHGQFNLVTATGEWIWNEGRPAAIPAVDGRRVIVLDPPPYEQTWNLGRPYPLMTPEITLNRILPAAGATGWTKKIQPAKPPT